MDEHISDCRKKAASRLRYKVFALNGLADILKVTNEFDNWGYVLEEISDGMLDLIEQIEGDEG